SIFSPGASQAANNCSTSGARVTQPLPIHVNPTGITIGKKMMSKEQQSIAETIIGIGEARNASFTDEQTILMIGLQESKLINTPGGTFNPGSGTLSIGVFSQTPPWWGTPDQIMDVVYATNSEYDKLFQIADRKG